MRTDQKLPKKGRVDTTSLSALTPGNARKGRGAVSNPVGRFENQSRDRFDDGWGTEFHPLEEANKIVWHRDFAKTIITRNQSPDIPFDRSINPYRGCEHGCIYCFARPTHSYLGHSAGVDFERQLYFKENAISLLKKELAAKKYEARVVALGVNTDAWQPEEKRLRLTRSLLQILSDHNHPVTMITKSGLIRRDIDLIAPMAEKEIARVAISLTTLDPALDRNMEPRAASPDLRLKTITALASAGIPVTVMIAPIIPCLNDAELENLLAAARDAGASHAGYVLLRLPHELKDIFHEWLMARYPDRAKRVINTLREMRGGFDYDADWQTRRKGEGTLARLIETRFHKAVVRLGYDQTKRPLRYDLFRKPEPENRQTSFDF